MIAEMNAERKTQAAAPAQPLRPAGWLVSLALFYIPAALLLLAFYIFRPWLETRGYDSLTSLFAALIVPLSFLFAAALIAFHKIEGHPLTRAAFASRMRYPRLKVRDVLVGLAIFALGMLGYGILSRLSLALIGALHLPLPANLPVLFDPHAVFSIEALDQAAGGSIRGRWDLLVLYAVMYFFNIVGEEFWWRGYIFPRQELAFGRWAWLVHGVMWASFHLFKWWDILALLPVCLLIAFASQKLRSNWAGFIAHALFNGLGVLLIIGLIAR
jgi:membrane protease YdiL (CAAX protease family)